MATHADDLPSLEELEGNFDIIFLDADKGNYQLYLDRILDRRLLSPRGVVFVDNGKPSFLLDCRAIALDTVYGLNDH